MAYGSALSRNTLEMTAAAKGRHPGLHVGQAIAARFGTEIGVHATAVIGDGDNQIIVFDIHSHAHFRRLGMSNNVVERLLEGQEQAVPHVRVHSLAGSADATCR